MYSSAVTMGCAPSQPDIAIIVTTGDLKQLSGTDNEVRKSKVFQYIRNIVSYSWMMVLLI